MKIPLINPRNGQLLEKSEHSYRDASGNTFPIVRGVLRISEQENYSGSFGVQWNIFDKTQLDSEQGDQTFSQQRLFAETRWDDQDLAEKDVLEVGSGAGRFSKVVLERTKANLYSIDYSDAVSANFKNNSAISPSRFHLFQASIYEMPFPDSSFDKVLCLGVLQHTPDFEASVRALISKAKPGGEIVVDFYPIKGWWTKIHAKYILRPLTKRISHERLLSLIDANIDWLMRFHFWLHRMHLGAMTRFLPICNVKESFPTYLTKDELREWAVLDTFDQYSPEHDHPQRISDVAKMFERNGARVTFSGYENYGNGFSASVVRALKL